MPLVQTRGAASAQGFGEFAQAATAVNYIEEVFSCFLYTGDGSTQTITNGIDLSTKGGLVWIKSRSNASGHRLVDTVRGATKALASNSTGGQVTEATGLTAFGSAGFTLGDNSDYNSTGENYASWTFRKQPKFFDVVTYTGNGTSQTISHNLGSVPGCIIVKRLNNASNTGWPVYHRYDYQLHGFLNLDNNFTGAQEETFFGNNIISVAPTSTVFTVGSNQDINTNTNTYVAYLFAHNAGGFGLTGTNNVISCGTYTGTGSAGNAQTLGYEPQWMIVKKSSSATVGDWCMVDTMRNFSMNNDNPLYANLSAAEVSNPEIDPTATGFQFPTGSNLNASAETYIYIAIRRGPMKVPTSGTSVFATQVYSSGSSPAFSGVSFPPDSVIELYRPGASAANGQVFGSKLQGPVLLQASSTSAETSEPDFVFYQNGFRAGSANAPDYAAEMFRRAPSFHDVVCYTGTGSATTFTHNLGAVPELMIVKRRNTTGAWDSYCSALANTEYLVLNTTAAKATGATRWNSTTPTSSVFSVGTSTTTNASGGTYVAYLFATCAGVSKVGSYTGTATTLQIDCGFTAGARFVLIKRTDSTGDWYVWDSARGIIAGNDPYLLLNSTAAEVTNTDYVDTYSAGFELSSTAPAAINANGGTFIFLAIA